MPPGVKHYEIQCRFDNRLMVGARRSGGNVSLALDFVPGATLRGAFARWHLTLPPGQQDWNGFLSEVSFCDLTPGGGAPIPLSARGCKYGEGFLDGMNGHGVYDALLPGFAHDTCCHICRGELKGRRGWMLCGAGFEFAHAEKHALGHTAVDIETRTAAPGLYYLEESVVARDGFIGEILVYPPGTIFDQLRALAVAGGLRIGHGRSKGMGSAHVFVRDAPASALPSIDERLRGMQTELNRRPGMLHAAGFSITLRSRAVLLDDYLRFRTGVEIADLVEAAGAFGGAALFARTLSGFQLAAAFTETERVFGWNEVSGMPRSPDLAVRGGAAFLFIRDDQPLAGAEVEALAQGFETVEARGIGERTGEGYGRIAICDPFHWRGEHERGGEFAPDGARYILH